MKIKVSFELEYDLPEQSSKDIKDAFMKMILTFYENNLPITGYGFSEKLSGLKVTRDYESPKYEIICSCCKKNSGTNDAEKVIQNSGWMRKIILRHGMRMWYFFCSGKCSRKFAKDLK